jgi:hypothetical protein
LGEEAADALRDWAELNAVSVADHLPHWSPPGIGYTGALLAAVEVAPPVRTVVVKVLPAGAHRTEPGAHARALRDSPAGFAAEHMVGQAFPPFPVPDGRLLMFQEVGGNGLGQTVPLRSLAGEDFTRACAEVVRGLLTQWNTAERQRSPRRMRASAFLQAELEATWYGGGTVQAWGERSQFVGRRPWVRVDGDVLPNPYLMVEGGHAALPDPEVSVLAGFAHRDLHLDNILVPLRHGEVQAGRYRLIDLSGATSDAPLTGDVAMMMLSALAPVVREPLPSVQQLALLRYVVSPRHEHLALIPPQVVAHIDCIRDTAAAIMSRWQDPWRDQFLLSVHATALIFTSFDDLGEAGRNWYMRLAAHAGGQFLAARGAGPTVEQAGVSSLGALHAVEPPAPVPAGRSASEEGQLLPMPAEDPRGGLSPRRRLVLVLETVPAMADLHSREAVLRLLPTEVKSSMPRSPVTRVDLLGVVDTCLQFPDGLSRLWEALCLVDPGTQARGVLAGVLAEFPSFRPADNDDR